MQWTRDPKVRARIRPVIADEAKTAQFLASKGVVLTSETHALFLDSVLDEFIAAILLLERRALGDYSEDEPARAISEVQRTRSQTEHHHPVGAVRGMGQGNTTTGFLLPNEDLH